MSGKELAVIRPDAVVAQHSVADVRAMAEAAVASGLFGGIKTKEAAFTLMLLAQAEGLHPVQALRRFDIIQGRPAMKADAMLGEFQARGGKVAWRQHDHEACEGVFSGPGCEPVTVRWTLDDAKRAGLAGKDTWKSYPRQMLRARVVSEGVRMTMPGVVVGIYTPEEVGDFDERRPARAAETAPAVKDSRGAANAEASGDIAAQPATERPWMKRLQAAVAKLGLGVEETKAKGLKGKEREDYVRVSRLLYLSWVIGREVESTLQLTDDEASKVIAAAEAGEMPGNDGPPPAEGSAP